MVVSTSKKNYFIKFFFHNYKVFGTKKAHTINKNLNYICCNKIIPTPKIELVLLIFVFFVEYLP